MKLFILLIFLLFPYPAHASDWSYPVDHYLDRESEKKFAQYFDTSWYIGKTDRFPLQFTGYHTGMDLEIFPSEENQPVPVYAVTSGKVAFAGNVSGYGGVILFRPENETVTFLYGHIKSGEAKTGQVFTSGQVLTYLGDAFSVQTGGERKHLHFAVYRGSDNYFRGYETSLSAVNSRFLDPNQYLQERIKITSGSTTPPGQPAVVPVPAERPAKTGLWVRILEWLKRFIW